METFRGGTEPLDQSVNADILFKMAKFNNQFTCTSLHDYLLGSAVRCIKLNPHSRRNENAFNTQAYRRIFKIPRVDKVTKKLPLIRMSPETELVKIVKQ